MFNSNRGTICIRATFMSFTKEFVNGVALYLEFGRLRGRTHDVTSGIETESQHDTFMSFVDCGWTRLTLDKQCSGRILQSWLLDPIDTPPLVASAATCPLRILVLLLQLRQQRLQLRRTWFACHCVHDRMSFLFSLHYRHLFTLFMQYETHTLICDIHFQLDCHSIHSIWHTV